MSNDKNIFGDMTVADILQRINNIINQTGYITSACEVLTNMGDGDSGVCGSPGNVMGEAKANALAGIVQSREATNQHILRLYEKMYDDMIRLSEAEQTPKENAETPME